MHNYYFFDCSFGLIFQTLIYVSRAPVNWSCSRPLTGRCSGRLLWGGTRDAHGSAGDHGVSDGRAHAHRTRPAGVRAHSQHCAGTRGSGCRSWWLASSRPTLGRRRRPKTCFAPSLSGRLLPGRRCPAILVGGGGGGARTGPARHPIDGRRVRPGGESPWTPARARSPQKNNARTHTHDADE